MRASRISALPVIRLTFYNGSGGLNRCTVARVQYRSALHWGQQRVALGSDNMKPIYSEFTIQSVHFSNRVTCCEDKAEYATLDICQGFCTLPIHSQQSLSLSANSVFIFLQSSQSCFVVLSPTSSFSLDKCCKALQ